MRGLIAVRLSCPLAANLTSRDGASIGYMNCAAISQTFASISPNPMVGSLAAGIGVALLAAVVLRPATAIAQPGSATGQWSIVEIAGKRVSNTATINFARFRWLSVNNACHALKRGLLPNSR
jgi:hypothetical protein